MPTLYRNRWSGRIFISKTILLYAIYRDSLFNKPPITRANTKRESTKERIENKSHIRTKTPLSIILSVVKDRRKKKKKWRRNKISVYRPEKLRKNILLFGKQDHSKVIS